MNSSIQPSIYASANKFTHPSMTDETKPPNLNLPYVANMARPMTAFKSAIIIPSLSLNLSSFVSSGRCSSQTTVRSLRWSAATWTVRTGLSSWTVRSSSLTASHWTWSAGWCTGQTLIWTTLRSWTMRATTDTPSSVVRWWEQSEFVVSDVQSFMSYSVVESVLRVRFILFNRAWSVSPSVFVMAQWVLTGSLQPRSFL